MEYNKLVRDKIPEIIKSNNEEAIYRYLSDNEFKEYLKLKLSEELSEVLNSKNDDETLKEIADLLEVIKFYLKVHNYTLEDALNMCEIKNEKKVHLIKNTSNQNKVKKGQALFYYVTYNYQPTKAPNIIAKSINRISIIKKLFP